MKSETKLKLMVLDDEPIVGKRLAPALSKINCEVETFTSSEAALEKLKEERFDILVTDIRMEGLDGIEVLEAVREFQPDLKVILITGYATVEVAREAMAKGAFDFIAKPFKPQELRDVVLKAARAISGKG